jgi:hypothetical protein
MMFALALGVRLVLIVASQRVDHGEIIHPAEVGDAKQYLDFGALFANDLEPREAIPPHRDRLMPFLFGLVFRFTGRSVLAAQLLCAVVATAGMFPMFMAAKTLLTEKYALIATALWAFDPSFVGQSCVPLTENIQTPLVITAVWLLLAVSANTLAPSAENRSGSACQAYVIASAIAMSLAFFARSSTIAIGLAAAIWLILRNAPWRQRLTNVTLYALILAASWTTSSYISYRLVGVFTPNTHTYALWGHAAAKMMIQHGDARSTEEGKEIRRAEARAQLPPDATLAEYLETKKRLDIDYIRQFPVQQFRNNLHALIAVTVMPDRWSIPAQFGIHRSGGLWQKPVGMIEKAKIAWEKWGPAVLLQVGAHLLFTFVLWLGVLAAIPQLFKGCNTQAVGLLFLCVAAVIASSALNVDAPPRYRLPAVPMMSLLAALSAQRLFGRGRLPDPPEAV